MRRRSGARASAELQHLRAAVDRGGSDGNLKLNPIAVSEVESELLVARVRLALRLGSELAHRDLETGRAHVDRLPVDQAKERIRLQVERNRHDQSVHGWTSCSLPMRRARRPLMRFPWPASAVLTANWTSRR